MTPWSETVAVVFLFLLRLGIPLAVTALVVWGMRRLDARWQAEAEASYVSRAVTAGKLQPANVTTPLAAQQPCWAFQHCSEAKRAGCAACKATDLPCWMARLRAEGRLPGRCYGCSFFRTRRKMERIPV
ncbi:MAG: hypothetical protein IPK16_10330 [Anaerolineales bacterium]|nr:hypothetical protein [Anaerolineales bacterium]